MPKFFILTFLYIHISYFITHKCWAHYINKSLHSFKIALCVYMQANTYSTLLNRAQRYLFTLRDQLLHLYFDFLLTEGDYLFALSI